jgi:hypothetical protein
MVLTHRLLAASLTACIGLFVAAPSVSAQDRHVVDRRAMTAAVSAKANVDDTDRAVVRQALHTPAAQAVADRFGLNLTRAEDAVTTLSPTEVHALAGPARVATTASGGDEIDISVTTLLLFLILIVLIVR